jgi:hypothetical protein
MVRDIIRTKGGRNNTVLVDNIDIYALREFQIKSYELQRQDDAFKPTPPDFDPDVVMNKINGSLWENIEKDLK